MTRNDSEGTTITLDTPEGVALTFTDASLWERTVAFWVDLCIIAALVVISLLPVWAFGMTGAIVVLLSFFFIRNGYFAFFEYAWSGTTPGKRSQRLRVVDERGAALPLEAVIVRNITREVEIMLPLTAFFAPGFLVPGIPSWGRFLLFVWPSLFIGIIFCNRRRRRFGDFLAGTHVVRSPLVELPEDLMQKDSGDTAVVYGDERYSFSDAHLAYYGEYELNALDELLRRPSTFQNTDAHRTVAVTICGKIGWKGELPDATGFLLAFYKAQRAYLERKMLFGKRKRDKHTPA